MGALLAQFIRIEHKNLEVGMAVLEGSESLANDPGLRTAAVLASSQLSRAETMYYKRMYKALNTLSMNRFQQVQLELARESSRQKAQSRPLRRRGLR